MHDPDNQKHGIFLILNQHLIQRSLQQCKCAYSLRLHSFNSYLITPLVVCYNSFRNLRTSGVKQQQSLSTNLSSRNVLEPLMGNTLPSYLRQTQDRSTISTNTFSVQFCLPWLTPIVDSCTQISGRTAVCQTAVYLATHLWHKLWKLTHSKFHDPLTRARACARM